MKKLNLLRKLDNPKVGDIAVDYRYYDSYKIEAIIGDQLCVSAPSCGGEVKAYLTNGDDLRQIPLIWLEDTPIYESDILYIKKSGQAGKIINHKPPGTFCVLNIVESMDNPTHMVYSYDELTLTKSKVKKTKWINVYPNNVLAALHSTKELADLCATSERSACIEISWEE